jgi:mannose/cellobiose epimerase-like protein (N-acyl-D-glucosamine 2-epimerase family)
LVPRGASNLVCTTFVAEALLDYHEATGHERWLDMALRAAEYILEELYWTKDGVDSFSYPFATSRVPVHNANLLAAALLCRLQKHSKKFEEIALKVSRYSATRQQADGSWAYGEGSTQGWVDNFHTGFNLCALNRIGEFLETDEFDPVLTRGYEFYRKSFFGADGAPRYFHNGAGPLDVHSAAQSLITLVELRELSSESSGLAEKVLEWTVKNLWNDEGFFYYQKRSWGTIRIPYMRWGQAWMLLALATVLEARNQQRRNGAALGRQTELTGIMR